MAKGHSEEITYKRNSNCRKGTTQGLSLQVCLCVDTYILYFFFLINTLFASTHSVFVKILFRKAKGPGPLSLAAGLVARTWCSRHRVPPQSLAGNPSPAANHCKLRLLKISVTPQTKDFQPRIPRLDFLISEKPTFIFTKWEDAPEYTDIGSLGVCSGLVCITCAPTTEPGS